MLHVLLDLHAVLWSVSAPPRPLRDSGVTAIEFSRSLAAALGVGRESSPATTVRTAMCGRLSRSWGIQVLDRQDLFVSATLPSAAVRRPFFAQS